MKTLTKSILIWIFIFSISSYELSAQDECGTTESSSGSGAFVNDFFGGYYKPQRTDRDDGSPSQSDATFNMLFVFIQFQDDTIQSGEWLVNQPPTYMNRFLVKDKNGTGQFWNRYKDSSLSDYYQEVSKGAFHVTGEARHLITNHTWDYYRLTPGVGYNGLLTEIYTRLKADLTINWTKFDKWSRNNSTNNYVNERDKYLDMMGLFFRYQVGIDFIAGPSGAELNKPGYVPLFGPEFNFYANGNDTVKVGVGRNQFGSGFIVKGNSVSGPLGYNRSMGIAIHEYGHYLFDRVHSTTGIMTSNGGISVNDLFMSGYEKYKLGLLDTATVNFGSSTTYNLGDVSGRNGSLQLLRVPISNNEFFIIENRRKISQWDTYMLGDTSQNDPFRNTGEYGKGIYIYHNNNIGLDYAYNVDVECADGLWNWTTNGYTYPDWSDQQTVNIKRRNSLPFPVNNDPGWFGSSSNADGISACPYVNIGKRHASVGLVGTDRYYTNDQEYWTTRELWGDRYDAWNVGYNQIFSPYSNPNTKTASNSQSEIFIYYESLNNGIANIKIYKTNEGFTENEILAVTPPSRPMGINLLNYFPPNSNKCNPKIVWNHNSEPDMVRSNGKKKYNVFKAVQPNLNSVPLSYLFLGAVEYPDSVTPYYIDLQVNKYDCGAEPDPQSELYPVRYMVKAVDKFDWESVPSDFVQAIGITGSKEEEDNFRVTSNIPSEYNVFQNYPNPFNPNTNIQYDLPTDNFVTIKIYNILGKEIATLLNENKTAGRYIISFNASKYPSGIYYYKIKAGSYEAIRKMILIK